MKNVVNKFNDVTSYIKYLDNGKVQKGFRDSAVAMTESFSGTKSWEAAKDLLAYGDPEMAKRVNDSGVKKARAKISRIAKRKTFATAIVGAIPHVPNYITGTPNSMITTKQVKVRKRVINLFYNAAFDYSIQTDDVINTAANVMSAIILIEASGVRVNLYAGCISEKRNQLAAAIVKVKDSKDRLDVLKLCYPMINPSWTRRHFMRYIDVTPKINSGFAYGHGTPKTTKGDKETVLKEAKISDAIILDYYEMVGKTTDEIIKFIEESK